MNESRKYAWRYLVTGDIRFYARKRRWVAMIRSVSLRVFAGHDSETCQECGRRYIWSRWVAPNYLYARVHGNRGGTLCPRCFSAQADAKGIKVTWTPVEETDIGLLERIMFSAPVGPQPKEN